MHLSIQEFMGAYYINSGMVNVSRQFKYLKCTFFLTHYTNLWIMFCGLIKTKMIKFQKLFTYSHTVEVSDISVRKLLSKLNDVGLFTNMSGIRNFNISDIAGMIQILCFKDSEEDFQRYKMCQDIYDTYLLLYQHGNIYIWK